MKMIKKMRLVGGEFIRLLITFLLLTAVAVWAFNIALPSSFVLLLVIAAVLVMVFRRVIKSDKLANKAPEEQGELEN